MKIKGRKNLEMKIQKIVREIVNADVFLAVDFCYYGETNVITFAPVIDNELGKIHTNWIMEKYNEDFSDPYLYWLFSLLHEVGHAVTLSDLTYEDLEFEYYMREILENGWLDSTEETSTVYFTLPAEILATEWAINFMNNNKEWTNKKLRKVFESLRHFYKKNA